VRLKDGTLLNRYWDDRNTPHEESYREDLATSKDASQPPEDLRKSTGTCARRPRPEEAMQLYGELPEKNVGFEEAFPGVEIEEA
jgi:hypothetical protein